jgi:hypothetical protein
VRVARALERLPLLSEAMRRGELSFAKIRAATRVATAANEEHLLDLARHGTASQLEKLVRAWRRVDRLTEQADERERHRSRSLTLYADDDGMSVVRGRLDPDVGALLERALAAACEAPYGRSEGADARVPDAAACMEPATIEQRRADAVGLIAECALRLELASGSPPDGDSTPSQADSSVGGQPGAVRPNAETMSRKADAVNRKPVAVRRTSDAFSRADRFQVVLHVEADALRASSDSGQAVLGRGVRVSAETSRRISCDASRVVMKHDAAGTVLDVGRRTRTVPPVIRRALDHRDGGCRFPGCGLRFCDVHHVVHWADGGATRLDNVILVCRRHHRALHEDGYRVVLTGAGDSRFYRPDGRPIPDAPAAPRLTADPSAALAAAHSGLGLEIDASTTASLWAGERLDLDFAVLTLRSPARPGAGSG